MAQRLIIVTDSAGTTRDQRNAITAFLEGKGWEVWHWYEDLWLVNNPGEPIDFGTLRDQLGDAVAGLKGGPAAGKGLGAAERGLALEARLGPVLH